jgi:hypothetical protein
MIGVDFLSKELVKVYNQKSPNELYARLFEDDYVEQPIIYQWELGKILKILSNEGHIERDIVFVMITKVEKSYEKSYHTDGTWQVYGSKSNGSWTGTLSVSVFDMDQKIRDLKLDDLLD